MAQVVRAIHGSIHSDTYQQHPPPPEVSAEDGRVSKNSWAELEWNHCQLLPVPSVCKSQPGCKWDTWHDKLKSHMWLFARKNREMFRFTQAIYIMDKTQSWLYYALLLINPLRWQLRHPSTEEFGSKVTNGKPVVIAKLGCTAAKCKSCPSLLVCIFTSLKDTMCHLRAPISTGSRRKSF